MTTRTLTMTTTMRAMRYARRFLPAVAALLASAPALALAQEFQKVEGKVADEIPAVPFVGIAYGFIWIAVLGYVIYVGRGLGRVNGELAELRRKLDGAAGGGAREAERK
jgi:CcmD family protein